MVTIARLTEGAARNRLAEDGVEALGITMPLLSPVWANAAFFYDETALTLTSAGPLQVPFLGVLETIDVPRDVFDVSGAPIDQPITRVRLHPHAAARLMTLARNRYAGAGQPLHLPVPTQVAIRDVVADPLVPEWYEAGHPLNVNGAMSFHDRRGLVVCPVAAAAMCFDLLDAFPALRSLSPDASDTNADVEDDGGVATVAGLAQGTLVHMVDPHGGAFVPVGRALTRRNGDAVEETLGAGALTTLAAGESFRADDADDAAEAEATADDAHDSVTGARLRWGWSNGGHLARSPLSEPALAAGTLPRRFLRLTVVDLRWHLLGNRSTAEVQDIPGDDGLFPETYQPKVRPDLPIDYLGDGVATLAAAGQVLDRIVGEQGIMFAVSPVLAPAVEVPPSGDATGRWPAWPGSGMAGFPAAPLSPATGISAAFTAENDVVVTIASGQVPVGAHVRIYPRQFVEILAIGAEPSFLRGDGGAAIALPSPGDASTAAPLQIGLRDPFALEGGLPPSPAILTMDIVVAPRAGQPRLFASVVVTVGSGPFALPPDPFAAGLDIVSAFADFLGSVCPVPLFGMPASDTPAWQPADGLVALFRTFIREEQPRQGPRLPTQARFETMVVTGIGPSSAPLDWDAVVTGARWSPESRSARHRDGNPGNPAGPDVHAAGIRVRGDLALDVARTAARRAMPMVALPPATFGWVLSQGGNNFNRPSVLAAGASEAPNAGAGALLRTISAVTESPEFGVTAFPLQTGPIDASAAYDALAAQIHSGFGLPGSPPTDFLEVQNEDRLGTEVTHELHVSRHGSRDALHALHRAFGQARELVYIESPQFAATGTVDLVSVLATRMQEMPSLRVVICLPRAGDFDPAYRSWVRQSISARSTAVATLEAAGPGRVAVFHPKGFPGRAAAIRTTSVIVDDAWALVGTSHLRRRGMTFDGAADIVSIPYALEDARAARLAAFRRELMMRKLGLEPTLAAALQTPQWARLAEMRSAFDAFRDLLDQGGAGLVAPLWQGPTDGAIPPADDDVADPDGSDGAQFISFFGELLGESGDS